MKVLKVMAVITAVVFSACTNSSCTSLKELAPYTSEENYAVFEFTGIEDIIWSPDDGCYYIEYNAPDAFDLDNLSYLTGREQWYGDYIIIDIWEDDLPEFLENYGEWRSTKDWLRKQELDEEWTIKEIWTTFSDGSKDVHFVMMHKPYEVAIEEENCL